MKEKEPAQKCGESMAEYRLRLEAEAATAWTHELEGEVIVLKTKVTTLKTQLFRYENNRENSPQLEFLTDLTLEIRNAVWTFMKSHENMVSARAAATEVSYRSIAPGDARKSALKLEDEFPMTMIRLRLGRLEKSWQIC